MHDRSDSSTQPSRERAASPYRQPVYVLTGDTTGAAQDFACCLRALGRVTIVGEPLSGTAPLVAVGRLDPSFDVFVPVGRPVHPRSGEPLGLVAADIPVEADRALEAACAVARRPLARGADDRAEPAGRTTGS
jgi:C-terminal processing protease CtpA/Prc